MARGFKVTAELSIAPLGHGETSIGRYVAAAIAAMKEAKGWNARLLHACAR